MVERRIKDDLFPVVVAHRGASSTHPENTLESFGAALDLGAQILEMDVRLTSDGVPVIMHDADVSRTTDGTGFVHELTFSQVKGLNAAPGRERRAEVPSLLEVLELVCGRGGVNLEIKGNPGDPGYDGGREAVVEAALRELAAARFEGSVLISSFNPAFIERCRAIAPGVPTGHLTMPAVAPVEALAYVREAGHDFVLPHVAALLPAGEGFVREARGTGVRVGTWTVDEPDLVRTLFSWGVDAVATNDPAMAAGIRAECVGLGS